MRKEIYDSLFNKTAETMTSEDYRLYRDLLNLNDGKKDLCATTAAFMATPFLLGAILAAITGVFTPMSLLPIGLLSAFIGGFSLFEHRVRVDWFWKIRKFAKKEFTKEDLKLMKKEKIYNKIKNLCIQFEKTDKYEEYKRGLEVCEDEEGVYFDVEERIQEIQEMKNNLDSALDGLRQAQKREKSSAELGKVFTEFDNTDDDTKGL